MALVRRVDDPAWHWSSVLVVQCGIGQAWWCSSVALVKRGGVHVWHWSSVVVVQCGIGQACCWSSVALVKRVGGPVWHWSSVLVVKCSTGQIWQWSTWQWSSEIQVRQWWSKDDRVVGQIGLLLKCSADKQTDPGSTLCGLLLS